jgi:hypothetical protein
MRKLLVPTLSAALCLATAAPAFAQEYRSAAFESPRGATATFNLRLPLGHAVKAKPSYGLSFGIGKTVGADYQGRGVTRQLQVADIRFGMKGELRRANFASFDLAHIEQDKRLNLTGGRTLLVGAGIVAVGVAVCLLTECLEGDDEDSFPTN